jgi:hypothetical protein
VKWPSCDNNSIYLCWIVAERAIQAESDMVGIPYKVYVVVEREFGEQLANLAPGVPVWIVNTPPNRAVAQRLWKERNRRDHLTGITTFNDLESSSPEDLLVSELDTIDLHHGSHSANPPYTILEVLGAPLSDRIKAELSQYGFDEFQPNAEGFSAVRPVPCE